MDPIEEAALRRQKIKKATIMPTMDLTRLPPPGAAQQEGGAPLPPPPAVPLDSALPAQPPGLPGTPPEEPGLIESLIRYLKAQDDAQRQAAGQGVADRVNAMLPEFLSGRQGVLRKRARMEQIDRQMEEGAK